MSARIRQLSMQLLNFGTDELALVEHIVERIRLGREEYGEWIADDDDRETYKEVSQELEDALVYLAMDAIRKSRKAGRQ